MGFVELLKLQKPLYKCFLNIIVDRTIKYYVGYNKLVLLLVCSCRNENQDYFYYPTKVHFTQKK